MKKKTQLALPKIAANSGGTSGKRGRPFEKGKSANPKGRPAEGESWSGLIKKIGNMTPLEAGMFLSDIKKKLDKLGDALTLKEIVILRAYSALALEANASLMNVLMDRAEGRTPSTLQLPKGGGGVITWEQFIAGALEARVEDERQDATVIDGVVHE